MFILCFLRIKILEGSSFTFAAVSEAMIVIRSNIRLEDLCKDYNIRGQYMNFWDQLYFIQWTFILAQKFYRFVLPIILKNILFIYF